MTVTVKVPAQAELKLMCAPMSSLELHSVLQKAQHILPLNYPTQSGVELRCWMVLGDFRIQLARAVNSMLDLPQLPSLAVADALAAGAMRDAMLSREFHASPNDQDLVLYTALRLLDLAQGGDAYRGLPPPHQAVSALADMVFAESFLGVADLVTAPSKPEYWNIEQVHARQQLCLAVISSHRVFNALPCTTLQYFLRLILVETDSSSATVEQQRKDILQRLETAARYLALQFEPELSASQAATRYTAGRCPPDTSGCDPHDCRNNPLHPGDTVESPGGRRFLVVTLARGDDYRHYARLAPVEATHDDSVCFVLPTSEVTKVHASTP